MEAVMAKLLGSFSLNHLKVKKAAYIVLKMSARMPQSSTSTLQIRKDKRQKHREYRQTNDCNKVEDQSVRL